MQLLVLGGFLGSGKTSQLINLAKYVIGEDENVDGAKVVILENEIGEVGVDDVILSSTGLQVSSLFNGCICCSLSGELIPMLFKLRDEFDPELVIIEATGVACPKQIRDTLVDVLDGTDVRICTLVDAKRWNRIKRAMANLIEQQLLDANTVLINKVDLVEPEVVEQVIEDLKEIDERETHANPRYFSVSAVQPVDPAVWQAVLGEDE